MRHRKQTQTLPSDKPQSRTFRVWDVFIQCSLTLLESCIFSVSIIHFHCNQFPGNEAPDRADPQQLRSFSRLQGESTDAGQLGWSPGSHLLCPHHSMTQILEMTPQVCCEARETHLDQCLPMSSQWMSAPKGKVQKPEARLTLIKIRICPRMWLISGHSEWVPASGHSVACVACAA